MVSTVDICNRALTKLGEARITSLNDDVKAAKACNHAYDFVKDAVLRDHPWSCTVSMSVLTALGLTPTHTYDYIYALPISSLKILHVDTDKQWAIHQETLLTDEGPSLNITYQSDLTLPSMYDPLLIEVIAARLAYELAEELTQSNYKKEAAYRDYRELLRSAKKNDAQESSTLQFVEDSWITVRY